MKPDHNQKRYQIDQRNSAEKKAQQASTSSTVLYDLQRGSLKTSANVLETQGKSPVQLRQGAAGPYAHQAYADRACEQRCSPKQLVTDNQPGEGSSSKAGMAAQSEGKCDSHLRPQKPKASYQNHTAASRIRQLEKSPLAATRVLVSQTEAPTAVDQPKQLDFLNNGRAVRDEIIERMQEESMKHFQALQRARPKSSTATTGSKRQRGNMKREWPHDPSSLTLKE